MERIILLVVFQWLAVSSAQISPLQGVNKTLDVAPGYPIEEYFVETSDGYILKLFRIAESPTCPKKEGKTVVFLMHGNTASANDWFQLGPGKSLPYLLSDAGYDVWLGNSRGNTYSRAHVTLSPESREFWQFCWDETGTIDLPMVIDFVLDKTEQKTLHYIGHSSGTTTFFILASELPEYNKKIATMQAFAPSAYLNHSIAPLFLLLKQFPELVQTALDFIGYYEFGSADEAIVRVFKEVVTIDEIFTELGAFIVFVNFGFDSEQLDRSIISKAFRTYPAGSSSRQSVQYLQFGSSGKFRRYDYHKNNFAKYGRSTPPEYNLTKVTAPVYLHYSENDWAVSEIDVIRLSKELGNLAGTRKIPWKKFNHIDYIYAKDAKTLLYDSALDIIAQYEDLKYCVNIY